MSAGQTIQQPLVHGLVVPVQDTLELLQLVIRWRHNRGRTVASIQAEQLQQQVSQCSLPARQLLLLSPVLLAPTLSILGCLIQDTGPAVQFLLQGADQLELYQQKLVVYRAIVLRRRWRRILPRVVGLLRRSLIITQHLEHPGQRVENLLLVSLRHGARVLLLHLLSSLRRRAARVTQCHRERLDVRDRPLQGAHILTECGLLGGESLDRVTSVGRGLRRRQSARPDQVAEFQSLIVVGGRAIR